MSDILIKGMNMPEKGDFIVIRPEGKAYYVSANPQNAYEREAVFVADVRPVVLGKWEDCTEYNGEYRCSVCKEFEGHKRNFCPNCGAEMRAEEDE